MARPPSSTGKRTPTAPPAAEPAATATTTTAQASSLLETALLDQVERLVVAAEQQTNMLARLIALHEASGRSVVMARATRARRTSDTRPIVVTPLVAAAVRRALHRVQRGRPPNG